ncbi:Lysophosphatidylcholine acyltransferase [Frankliniella fusca]|uniref:Lysophosphatidylcholine acyltransferase n=1 Tax=Frankliniella fusca TaxID=407009 RepID=A0AAE1I004_9NEOP|nr:Lysophosphatidylcholine acyltransferase [Frankliniella fusca]
MNGKMHPGDEFSADLLNPFVHRLEFASTYDKIKTLLFTVTVLPLRVMAIAVLLVLAWLLACIGLIGVSEEDLRTKPMTGWRKDTKSVLCLLMRGLFAAGGFHRVHIKGRQAAPKEAPVLALAPHSSYFDALPVVCLGAPSVVAKGETGYLPFFGIFRSTTSIPYFLTLSVCVVCVAVARAVASCHVYYLESIALTVRRWISVLGRWSYEWGGMSLEVKGRQAPREEAPVLVAAPHSTFLDAGILYLTGYPSIICRRESGRNPWLRTLLLAELINYTQPVYVWREDPMSRQKSIKEIIQRATSPLDWPQVLIFPEGTCTNRSCLITFKHGAFYPGVPVQPVCIRYPNKLDTVTWTWEGPGALKLLWMTLTQPHSSCEIEFLPVYRPSEEEKKNPKLFAQNVRQIMAK